MVVFAENKYVTKYLLNTMYLVLITLFMSWSSLCGIPKSTFKQTKHRFSIAPLVQLHNIIPRQFRKHPVVVDFNMEDGANYMFMPNVLGKQLINTCRPNHNGGHQAYNRYVQRILEHIYSTKDPVEHLYCVQKFSSYLRNQICNGCKDIPWK
tara:strand:- start:1371 stop:1826 length:456 start_codon:yes stop_codon:yes gene_type:complete